MKLILAIFVPVSSAIVYHFKCHLQ